MSLQEYKAKKVQGSSSSKPLGLRQHWSSLFAWALPRALLLGKKKNSASVVNQLVIPEVIFPLWLLWKTC